MNVHSHSENGQLDGPENDVSLLVIEGARAYEVE